jgi:FKBP-type peptidyl-prolyl cis-trans isomerase (trigger factor)
MSKDYTFTKKTTSDDETELSVKVGKDMFLTEKAKMFKKLSNEVNVPGFRPGKGPQNLLEAKLGTKLFEETLNQMIPVVTLNILKDEKINPITQIKYDLKKATNEEGVEYVATFVELPKFELGDFKKIKVEEPKTEVSENEVDQAIKQLLEINNKAKADKDDKKEEKQELKITDESVKELKLGFETVAALKAEMRKRIEEEKKLDSEAKKLELIVKEAIKISKIKIPNALVKSELERKEHDYTHKVEDLGLKLEDFLKSQNMTLEEQRIKWSEEIKLRLENELLFIEIARLNNITVPNSEIEAEISQIKDPKLKKEYDSDFGRRYISSVLIQQKAIRWLKEQTESK